MRWKVHALLIPPTLFLCAAGWLGWTLYEDVFLTETPLYVGPQMTPGTSVAISGPIGSPCDVRYAVTTCTNYNSRKYAPRDANSKEPVPFFVEMYRIAAKAIF